MLTNIILSNMLILILIIWIWNRLNLYFIKESCVRSIDRDQAQKHLTEALQLLQSKYTFDAIAKGKKIYITFYIILILILLFV